MRLALLTALAMAAFAANSVLTRLGVGVLGMDALAFAAWRTVAGAVLLCAIAWGQGARPGRPGLRRWAGAGALALYMIGFSLAYRSLDAGFGALVLFGALQLLLFGSAVIGGEEVGARRWAGMALALAGLAWLLWPGPQNAGNLPGTLAMLAAAAGWAVYTILGRREAAPVRASAANFALCAPLVVLAALPGLAAPARPEALACAMLAGAVTSGLGYVLWYRVLPSLAVSAAGVAQLSVPVLALLAGAALLGEAIGPRLWLASTFVLGGIALAVTQRRPSKSAPAP